MIKKFSLFVLALILSSAIPAHAGVMTRMVEVGEQDRKANEECLVGLEECVKDKERLRMEADDMKSRLQKLLGELTNTRRANQELQSQVSQLQGDNDLLAKKIDELKANVNCPPPEAPKKVAEAPKKVEAPKVEEAKSIVDCPACSLLHVVGPIFSTPVGTVVGTVRGAGSKASELAGKSDNAIVKVGGGVFGLISGAVTGVFKGFFNGLVYGVTKPFSAESFSTGPAPYDPYKFFN
ncbi:MAG: hypothetical protein LW817_01230 [Candidatus Caenarcaniphilales bacterium]|jgi:hypothetical protein|nr:hypothetical protein [Candidatus Caenarcaniphilales bacterium]